MLVLAGSLAPKCALINGASLCTNWDPPDLARDGDVKAVTAIVPPFTVVLISQYGIGQPMKTRVANI